MSSFRSMYRIPVIEAVLIAAVVFQICSGLTFVVRGWKQRHGFIPWLQAGLSRLLLPQPCRCSSFWSGRAQPRYQFLLCSGRLSCVAFPVLFCPVLLSRGAGPVYTFWLCAVLAATSQVTISPCAGGRTSSRYRFRGVTAYRALSSRGVLSRASAARIQSNVWVAALNGQFHRLLPGASSGAFI